MKHKKRILALVLVGLLLMTGCGKTLCSMENCKNAAVEDEVYGELYCEEHLAVRKAFELSKQAFDQISNAYEIAVMMFMNHGDWQFITQMTFLKMEQPISQKTCI